MFCLAMSFWLELDLYPNFNLMFWLLVVCDYHTWSEQGYYYCTVSMEYFYLIANKGDVVIKMSIDSFEWMVVIH